MTLAEVLAFYKTAHKFEKETKMSHNSIKNWERLGYIPFASQRKLEQLSNGYFKIRLEDLGST